MKPIRRAAPTATIRRGMLLLLVLLMLALFLGAGAILLTVALRARAAARAHAAATTQANLNEGLPRAALDEALMALLRGSPAAVGGSVAADTGGPVLENLLEDKYGPPVTGTGAIVSTGSIASGTNSPVMTLSITSLPSSITPYSRLNGRILTIKPRAGDVGDVASFRILGVSGSTTPATCYVSRMPSLVNRTLPSQAFEIVINGREFTPVSGTSVPESYDAPDDQNAWLAWPSVTNNQLSGTFNRLSFSPFGTSAYLGGADNDNDGVPDGVWISGTVVTATNALIPGVVIPDRASPLGGTLRFEVSYLVLDLDGRINVNAAGMANRDLASYAASQNAPLGMGYGPADVDVSLLFSGSVSGSNSVPTLPVAAGTSAFTGAGASQPPGVWPTLLLNNTTTLRLDLPSEDQRRRPPVVGMIFGRAGSNAVPGIAGDDTAGGQTTNQALYTTTIAGSNAFADLKARAKVYMTATTGSEATPSMTFYVPTWSSTNSTVVEDSRDDPYEVRLDGEGPRFGMPRRPTPLAGQNDDSPFTLGELERILRPTDADAVQLPQRLAAGLQDAGQRARTTITSESWDTPALTGAAALVLEDAIANPARMPAIVYSSTSWLSGTTTRNSIPAEIAAGLRFNINRPVASGTTAAALAEQHEYCKDLYTLVMALSGTSGAVTPAQAAQWAANVLDFRDEDSRMTGFEYDTDPSDGWDVDGLVSSATGSTRAIAWGAERPEFVITETAAFNDTDTNTRQLFVTLHRPPQNARVIGTSGTTPVELPDPLIGGTTIDLGRLAGTTPIWQLRFQPNSAVQFNAVASATTQNQVLVSGSTTVTVVGNTTAAAPIGANGYLCVHSTSPQQFSVAVTPHPVVSGSFEPPGTGSVTLERLADPSRPNSADNPYVPVDTARVLLNTLPLAPNATLQTNRRTRPEDMGAKPMAGFWAQLWTGTSNSTLSTYAVGSPAAPWFHWPNRPFVSQAELALIASGTIPNRTGTDHILANHDFPPQSLAMLPLASGTIPVSGGLTPTTTSGSATLGQLILDATYVPTRFAGNAVTVTGTTTDPLGFSEPGHNTLPRWREPGRVNVNTIITGTGATDAIVWAALTGSASLVNPFMTATTSPANSTPARTIGQLLSLRNVPNQQVEIQPYPATDPRGLNPFLAASLPVRLANTATVRSNVFAVWISVRIIDTSANAALPVTKRMFAIIDRSIPVGYAPGQDLNVRDCIRLKRYID